MDPLSKVVVLMLMVTSSVISSPLINELEEGKKWPGCQEVKQPYELDQIENKTEEIITEKKGNPKCPKHEVKEPYESDVQKVTDTKLIEEVPEEANADDQAEDLSDQNGVFSRAANVKSEGQKVTYTGAQLWKVYTDKTGVRATIGRLSRRNLISSWGGNQSAIDILVKPEAINNVTRVFKRENIKYEIVIEDLQKNIQEENPPLDANELLLQIRRGHRLTWKQYHRLEDIHDFLSYLAKTYPAIVSVQTIGKSYEGREIKLLRLSNGNPSNKAVFIDGGIHAREWISPATVTYFINQFVENFDVESDEIKNIDWYFVPVINTDGYEYTHTIDRLWRKNRKPAGGGRACSGVDLNRNFGYHWGGKGASRNPCSEIYCGSSAFSEPESQAVSNFIKNNAGIFSAYITYHSYGQYLLYPWGYDNVVPPDYQELDAMGKKIASAIQETRGTRYDVGSSSGLLYPASGGSDDWAKSQGIKYTYTIELSDTGRYGFILPTSFIEPVASESLLGLRALAKQLSQE